MEAHLRDGRNAAVSEAAAGRTLCRLDDIEDGAAKGFAVGEGTQRLNLFVVRDGARVYGYVNSCPHQGTPLDWTPDRFISDDTGLILCATHGALFEIEDGLCVAGPCAGAHLTPLPVAVRDGAIVFARSSRESPR
jgi:nitrite reductase/ring-hydroxylating ferredoxin subunit